MQKLSNACCFMVSQVLSSDGQCTHEKNVRLARSVLVDDQIECVVGASPKVVREVIASVERRDPNGNRA
jgi:predicted nucleic acid-binding Zn finger protein